MQYSGRSQSPADFLHTLPACLNCGLKFKSGELVTVYIISLCIYVVFRDTISFSQWRWHLRKYVVSYMETAGYHPLFPVIIALLQFQCGFKSDRLLSLFQCPQLIACSRVCLYHEPFSVACTRTWVLWHGSKDSNVGVSHHRLGSGVTQARFVLDVYLTKYKKPTLKATLKAAG